MFETAIQVSKTKKHKFNNILKKCSFAVALKFTNFTLNELEFQVKPGLKHPHKLSKQEKLNFLYYFENVVLWFYCNSWSVAAI